MPSLHKLLPLILRQNLGRQILDRKPEPEAITSADENVTQYDRVMETKLAISYAIAIETIYRARRNPFGGKALDIACGPGHFSITMARELKLEELVGVDLSDPMVEIASRNASQQGMNRLNFQEGDATALKNLGDGEFDLTTMMDAAHHMLTLEMVTLVIAEMDRVTKPDGLCVLMDLVRLRTEEITEAYVRLLAHDYVKRGLPHFFEDFRKSMYAAWTPSELCSSVPNQGTRQWYIVVPRCLPFAQFLIGIPSNIRSLFLRNDRLWNRTQVPIARTDFSEFALARLTMKTASVRQIPG